MNNKLMIVLILYLFTMHLTMVLELSVNFYDLMISIGLVIISLYVYLTCQINSSNKLKLISYIILSGSVSNCIDEIFNSNTYTTNSNYIYELITWVSLLTLLIYLNKNIMPDRSEIINSIAMFISKHFLIISVASLSALLNTYIKRKEKLKWYERLIELILKFSFGFTIPYFFSLYSKETNTAFLIALTVIVTMGCDIIAIWIMSNLKEVLDSIKNRFLKSLDK